nr:MerR family transcriptional regulator [Streptomyces sp. SAJ15]
MRIGELARETGVTPRALRHYEQAGLLSSERGHNGYRDYTEQAVRRVRNIRYLLDAGLTLEDVSCFLPCLDGDLANGPVGAAGLNVARNRLAVLDARIAAQTRVRDRLASALRAVDVGESDTPVPDPPSDPSNPSDPSGPSRPPGGPRP